MIYDVSVDSATIEGLLQPYATLRAVQIDQVSTYLDLLLRWNSRINLTAVREPKEIVRRHFGESFFAAERLLQPDDALLALDLGSGAGFPGLPLALFAPSTQVTLVESNGRKAAFLNEVISAVKLSNAAVFSQRAESYAGAADLVTMRAVERFSSTLPLALRLTQGNGRIALMIGSAQLEEARSLTADVSWQEPIFIPGGHSRVLVVGTKKAPVGE